MMDHGGPTPDKTHKSDGVQTCQPFYSSLESNMEALRSNSSIHVPRKVQ